MALILPHMGPQACSALAERMRVSIAAADARLHRAKREGQNRTLRAAERAANVAVGE